MRVRNEKSVARQGIYRYHNKTKSDKANRRSGTGKT
nr:MAG TPA: hypothetical protein [Caudoviricetes sp.]